MKPLVPERAVMIGDRAGDIVGARANGIRSIGVLWGYGSEEELLRAKPDCVAESMAALIGLVDAKPPSTTR